MYNFKVQVYKQLAIVKSYYQGTSHGSLFSGSHWAFTVSAVHGEILVAGATWNLISNIDNDYSTQYSCFNRFSFAKEVTVTGP